MEIIKVPLDDVEKILPQQKFGRLPILYLELFENKSKVKREFVGKQYEPVLEEVPQEPPQAPNQEEGGGGEPDEPEKGVENEDSDKGEEIDNRLHSILGEDRPAATNIPPTLSELQAKNPKRPILQKEYRYAEEEDEETIKERNEIFFHYEVLRRMHPNANIPEFTVYTDPKTMAHKYQMLAKKLSLESSVENWKRYMIVFVMGCEVVLGKLNLDMEGFAQQQIMSMTTYDQLLVELAEKSYVPSGASKWPAEIRLLMMLSMNVVLFIISKMIFKKTGTNLLGTINDVTNTQEKKMKEP